MAVSYLDHDENVAKETLDWSIKDITEMVQKFDGTAYLALYGALKFGEEVFMGYSRWYPDLVKLWIGGNYVQYRNLTDPSKKDVLIQKLDLLKQARQCIP